METDVSTNLPNFCVCGSSGQVECSGIALRSLQRPRFQHLQMLERDDVAFLAGVCWHTSKYILKGELVKR